MFLIEAVLLAKDVFQGFWTKCRLDTRSVTGKDVKNGDFLLAYAGFSMNILYMGNKLSMQRDFFNNSTDNLLPVLNFLAGLYNFCNFVITFSLMKVTMICRRATYFRTDLQIWKWWNTTAEYVRQYKICTLKIIFNDLHWVIWLLCKSKYSQRKWL